MKKIIFLFFVLSTKNSLYANNDFFFNAISQGNPDCAFISLNEAKQLSADGISNDQNFLYLTSQNLEERDSIIQEMCDKNKVALFIHDHEIKPNQESFSDFLDAFGNIHVVLNTSKGFFVKNGSLHFQNDAIKKIKHLSIINNDQSARTIGDDFLCFHKNLERLDLKQLLGIKRIGNRFLFSCAGLSSFDLNFLRKVTHIRDHFLYSCEGLTCLDLSPLSAVQTIGRYFLSYCRGLRSIDLRFSSCLESIGEGPVFGCTGLTSLNYPDIMKEYIWTDFRFSISHHPENVLRRYIEHSIEDNVLVDFIVQQWAHMHEQLKFMILQLLIKEYGQEHPQMQKLFWIMAQHAGNAGSFSVYKNLVEATNGDLEHHPKILKIKLNQGIHTQELLFRFSADCFSYQPVTDEALASLDDVDTLLGKDVPPAIKAVRNEPEFTSYFSRPFSREGMMLQAIVKKYTQLSKEEAEEHLRNLLSSFQVCIQGKNEEIQRQYKIESEPIPMADLKNMASIIIQLSGKEREILERMCSLNHPFGNCLRSRTDTRSKLLRALLGKYINDNETILNIINELKEIKTFDQKLRDLFLSYHITLPANIYNDDLSLESFQSLIDLIQEEDLDGRVELSRAQETINLFLNHPTFKATLTNWESEHGCMLRRLMEAYVRNKWFLGLFNLAETCLASNNFSQSIEETFHNTQRDREVIWCYRNLKEIILDKVNHLKREALYYLSESIIGEGALSDPHNTTYIENLLARHIGLKPQQSRPDFDMYLSQAPTSKNLQEILDSFYEFFHPQALLLTIRNMIKQNNLSIIDSEGCNIIWELIRESAKEFLQEMGFSNGEIIDLIYKDDSVTDLALALLLDKIKILERMYP